MLLCSSFQLQKKKSESLTTSSTEKWDWRSLSKTQALSLFWFWKCCICQTDVVATSKSSWDHEGKPCLHTCLPRHLVYSLQPAYTGVAAMGHRRLPSCPLQPPSRTSSPADITQVAARPKSSADLPFRWPRLPQSVETKWNLAKESFLENDPLSSKNKRKTCFIQDTIYVCVQQYANYSIA